MITLAWRNMWRNKRRTLITAASVFFAVFFAIIMRGFHSGTWNFLIDSVLHSYSGYIQVHQKGYWDNKSFDYSIAANDSLFNKIASVSGVKGLVPRIESFSLASFNEKTKGAITVGVDTEIEKLFTSLDNKVVQGRYFNSSDSGIILSERLAKYLEISVNDTLVLLSQGHQGASANGIFKVIGIVKLPAPEFDNQTVFMPLAMAQEFYSMQNRLTSIVVDIEDPEKMHKTLNRLTSKIDLDTYEVMSWEQMLVELYQQYVSDEGGGIIMLALLYLIVGFGVFGTVLMMVSERKHEYAIMVTVGMQRYKLMKLLSYELAFVCLLGVVFGVLFSVPIVGYFHFNPIHLTGDLVDVYASFGMEPVMPAAWGAGYIVQQATNIGVITFLALIFPVYSVYKLNITNSLRK